MSRFFSAILLIALGLAVGLWLGLNPQGREAVQRANETFVQVKTDVAVWWDQIRSDSGASQSSAPSAESQAAAREDQTAAPSELWAAAQQVWLNFMARLRQEI